MEGGGGGGSGEAGTGPRAGSFPDSELAHLIIRVFYVIP